MEHVRQLVGALADDACRYTPYDRVGRHVARHDGTGRDHYTLARSHARQDDRASADEDPVTDVHCGTAAGKTRAIGAILQGKNRHAFGDTHIVTDQQAHAPVEEDFAVDHRIAANMHVLWTVEAPASMYGYCLGR